MTMWSKLRRWLPGGKDEFRGEIGEELKQHVDELTQENIRRGMSEDEARRAATLRFGNVGAISDSVQSERRVFRFEEVMNDLRFGARVLVRNPGFALIAILTLALGIGGTTAIFSVVNNVLLKPFSMVDPEHTLILWSSWNNRNGNVSVGNYVDWRAQSRTMEAIAAAKGSNFTLEEMQTPERLAGNKVTANFFKVFGIQPLMGRTFTEEEDQPGNDNVIVLSEAFWRSHFQSDANVLGKTLRLSGRTYTVIGVMPAKFDPIDDHEQLWAPIAFTPEQRAEHDDHYLFVVGRLKLGITTEQAQSEMNTIAKVQRERFPKENLDLGVREIKLQRLDDAIVEDTRPALYMLLGAVAAVLLIACVNVGTLQLARARSRRKEIAIRSALGASSWRVVRQLLAESLLLSALGGLCGLVLARWMLQFIVSRAPTSIPRIADAKLDGGALLFALATVVFAAVVSGGWAAARARKSDPGQELAAGRTSGGAAVQDRLRGAMVVTEVALAIMLMVGAGLLIRSAMAANRVDLGFDASHLLVGRVTLPESRYKEPEQVKATFQQIRDAAAAIPGVQSATVVNRTPMAGGNNNGLIPEGRSEKDIIQSDLRLATPSYLATVRVPLKMGRIFTDADVEGSEKVMLINQTLAQAAFPNQNPLGKRISCCDGSLKTVVGVVGDVRTRGLTGEVTPEYYLPMAQTPGPAWEWMGRTMEVVVRTSGDPNNAVNDLRSMMRQIDPAVPVYSVATMEERIGNTLKQRRFTMSLLTSFAGLALFLASIGIYGVLSYTVTQRTQEIGIRMALGANRTQVLRMVVGQGLRLVVFGTAIGILGSLAVSRFMSTLLFGVAPTDAAAFAMAPAVLVGLTLLASYVPAARAMRIDPMVALRYE